MDQPEKTVLVVGVGARTVVGMNAPATAAAVRTAMAGFNEHSFMLDTTGKPMIVAAAPYLSADIDGAARLAELAGPAAAEAIAQFAAAPGGKPVVHTFVGLPAPRPGRQKDTAAVVTEQLRAELARAGLRAGPTQALEMGHAAGSMAVQAAWEAVRSGATSIALAGGVDSYLDAETLMWLEASDQIHGAGADPNSWGFIPGEAAGFVLLMAADLAVRHEATAALEVLTAATARETKLIKTDAVCLGEGLTELFRLLAGGLVPGTRVDHLVCDMNGEAYRADEFGFAVLRAGGLFRDASAFATPASQWGDVGAASGPLFLVLSDTEARKGYARGPVTAAFTSSESGERCGFVARVREPGGGGGDAGHRHHQ